MGVRSPNNKTLMPTTPSTTPPVTPLRLLLHYLRPQRKRFVMLMCLLLTGIALRLIQPQIIRWFIDGATEQRPLRALIGAAALFIGATLLQQAFLIATTYVGENVGWRATNDLRVDLARHALGLDLSFHKTHRPGELIERVDGDVNELAKFFSQLVVSLLGNLLLLIGVLAFLWWEDWRIGLGITAIAGLSAIIVETLRRRMTPRWEQLRSASADLLALVEERLHGLEDVRANGGEKYVMHRLYGLLHGRIHAMQHAMNLNVFLIIFPIWSFGVIYAAAHLLGGARFAEGALTIGGVYLIFHYIGLLESPLWEVLRQVEEFQKVDASINRIGWLFGVQPTVEAGVPRGDVDRAAAEPTAQLAATGPLALAFDSVSFHYEDDPDLVLRDLSFELEAGRVLGLLGRTGSGKSTLTKLLFASTTPPAVRSACAQAVARRTKRPGAICATSRSAIYASALRSLPRRCRYSTPRCATTSRSSTIRWTTRASSRRWSRLAWASGCAGCRMAWRLSCRAAGCRRARRSCSPSPASSCATPASSCSMKPRRGSIRPPKPPSSRRWTSCFVDAPPSSSPTACRRCSARTRF